MAGRKRKVDVFNTRSSQSIASGDSSKQTGVFTTAKSTATRGRRGKAAATATQFQADGVQSSKTAGALGTTSQEESSSAQDLKSPPAKRQKVSHSTEVLQPTRFSARLKSRAQTPLPEMPPNLSPQSSTEPAEVSKNLETVIQHDEENNHVPESTSTGSNSNEISRLTPKSSDAEASAKTEEPLVPMTTRGRKRRLAETTTESPTKTAKKMKVEDTVTTNLESVSKTPKSETTTDIPTTDAKLPKVEEEAAHQSTPAVAAESASTGEEAHSVQETEAISQSVNDSAQTSRTEDLDTRSAQNGATGGPGTRGRGKRGGGRGRGRGKAKSSNNNGKKPGPPPAGGGRGRGGGRGGGRPGKRTDDDSDFEVERPGPPNPYTQKLNDRQKELKQNFKRLAATQKLILNELAGRTQQTLARHKTAHRDTAEYEEMQKALEMHLERRLKILGNEHHLRVEQANRLLEAETQIIQNRYEASAVNIQDELFYAARGEYMGLVEGVQHAGDDEHTEPDLDGPGPEPSRTTAERPASDIYEHEPYYLNEPKFTRGFNSRFVRETSGAASYERGRHGWDDFLQRAKLNEISQEESAADSLQLLVQASQEALANEAGPPSSVDTDALSALADAASTAPPVSSRPSFQYSSQSTLNQHRLPSIMLPQAAPPSRSTLPPSRGFPDYYSMDPRMHQLPPPRLGLDDYSNYDGPLARLGFDQRRNSNIQYHPFPPPAPLPRATSRNPAPHPYYYPNSHSNPYQSGPPSQPSSSTARRPY